MEEIRVLVADDHPLYREGVARILSEAPPLVVIGQAGDAEEAVRMTQAQKPDVVLLDMSMPKGGGLAALRAIRQHDPAPRVAMLTVSEEEDDVLQALKSGASGYILKGVGGRELVGIVKDIAGGRSFVSPLLAARILTTLREGKPAHPLDALSAREEDILRLVAEGLSNKEVGLRLDLQEKTVKHYMTSILHKLHARNRTEAALMARDHWSG